MFDCWNIENTMRILLSIGYMYLSFKIETPENLLINRCFKIIKVIREIILIICQIFVCVANIFVRRTVNIISYKMHTKYKYQKRTKNRNFYILINKKIWIYYHFLSRHYIDGH